MTTTRKKDDFSFSFSASDGLSGLYEVRPENSTTILRRDEDEIDFQKCIMMNKQILVTETTLEHGFLNQDLQKMTDMSHDMFVKVPRGIVGATRDVIALVSIKATQLVNSTPSNTEVLDERVEKLFAARDEIFGVLRNKLKPNAALKPTDLLHAPLAQCWVKYDKKRINHGLVLSRETRMDAQAAVRRNGKGQKVMRRESRKILATYTQNNDDSAALNSSFMVWKTLDAQMGNAQMTAETLRVRACYAYQDRLIIHGHIAQRMYDLRWTVNKAGNLSRMAVRYFSDSKWLVNAAQFMPMLGQVLGTTAAVMASPSWAIPCCFIYGAGQAYIRMVSRGEELECATDFLELIDQGLMSVVSQLYLGKLKNAHAIFELTLVGPMVASLGESVITLIVTGDMSGRVDHNKMQREFYNQNPFGDTTLDATQVRRVWEESIFEMERSVRHNKHEHRFEIGKRCVEFTLVGLGVFYASDVMGMVVGTVCVTNLLHNFVFKQGKSFWEQRSKQKRALFQSYFIEKDANQRSFLHSTLALIGGCLEGWQYRRRKIGALMMGDFGNDTNTFFRKQYACLVGSIKKVVKWIVGSIVNVGKYVLNAMSTGLEMLADGKVQRFITMVASVGVVFAMMTGQLKDLNTSSFTKRTLTAMLKSILLHVFNNPDCFKSVFVMLWEKGFGTDGALFDVRRFLKTGGLPGFLSVLALAGGCFAGYVTNPDSFIVSAMNYMTQNPFSVIGVGGVSLFALYKVFGMSITYSNEKAHVIDEFLSDLSQSTGIHEELLYLERNYGDGFVMFRNWNVKDSVTNLVVDTYVMQNINQWVNNSSVALSTFAVQGVGFTRVSASLKRNGLADAIPELNQLNVARFSEKGLKDLLAYYQKEVNEGEKRLKEDTMAHGASPNDASPDESASAAQPNDLDNGPRGDAGGARGDDGGAQQGQQGDTLRGYDGAGPSQMENEYKMQKLNEKDRNVLQKKVDASKIVKERIGGYLRTMTNAQNEILLKQHQFLKDMNQGDEYNKRLDTIATDKAASFANKQRRYDAVLKERGKEWPIKGKYHSSKDDFDRALAVELRDDNNPFEDLKNSFFSATVNTLFGFFPVSRDYVAQENHNREALKVLAEQMQPEMDSLFNDCENEVLRNNVSNEMADNILKRAEDARKDADWRLEHWGEMKEHNFLEVAQSEIVALQVDRKLTRYQADYAKQHVTKARLIASGMFLGQQKSAIARGEYARFKLEKQAMQQKLRLNEIDTMIEKIEDQHTMIPGFVARLEEKVADEKKRNANMASEAGKHAEHFIRMKKDQQVANRGILKRGLHAMGRNFVHLMPETRKYANMVWSLVEETPSLTVEKQNPFSKWKAQLARKRQNIYERQALKFKFAISELISDALGQAVGVVAGQDVLRLKQALLLNCAMIRRETIARDRAKHALEQAKRARELLDHSLSDPSIDEAEKSRLRGERDLMAEQEHTQQILHESAAQMVKHHRLKSEDARVQMKLNAVINADLRFQVSAEIDRMNSAMKTGNSDDDSAFAIDEDTDTQRDIENGVDHLFDLATDLDNELATSIDNDVDLMMDLMYDFAAPPEDPGERPARQLQTDAETDFDQDVDPGKLDVGKRVENSGRWGVVLFYTGRESLTTHYNDVNKAIHMARKKYHDLVMRVDKKIVRGDDGQAKTDAIGRIDTKPTTSVEKDEVKRIWEDAMVEALDVKEKLSGKTDSEKATMINDALVEMQKMTDIRLDENMLWLHFNKNAKEKLRDCVVDPGMLQALLRRRVSRAVQVPGKKKPAGQEFHAKLEEEGLEDKAKKVELAHVFKDQRARRFFDIAAGAVGASFLPSPQNVFAKLAFGRAGKVAAGAVAVKAADMAQNQAIAFQVFDESDTGTYIEDDTYLNMLNYQREQNGEDLFKSLVHVTDRTMPIVTWDNPYVLDLLSAQRGGISEEYATESMFNQNLKKARTAEEYVDRLLKERSITDAERRPKGTSWVKSEKLEDVRVAPIGLGPTSYVEKANLRKIDIKLEQHLYQDRANFEKENNFYDLRPGDYVEKEENGKKVFYVLKTDDRSDFEMQLTLRKPTVIDTSEGIQWVECAECVEIEKFAASAYQYKMERAVWGENDEPRAVELRRYELLSNQIKSMRMTHKFDLHTEISASGKVQMNKIDKDLREGTITKEVEAKMKRKVYDELTLLRRQLPFAQALGHDNFMPAKTWNKLKSELVMSERAGDQCEYGWFDCSSAGKTDISMSSFDLTSNTYINVNGKYYRPQAKELNKEKFDTDHSFLDHPIFKSEPPGSKEYIKRAHDEHFEVNGFEGVEPMMPPMMQSIHSTAHELLSAIQTPIETNYKLDKSTIVQEVVEKAGDMVDEALLKQVNIKAQNTGDPGQAMVEHPIVGEELVPKDDEWHLLVKREKDEDAGRLQMRRESAVFDHMTSTGDRVQYLFRSLEDQIFYAKEFMDTSKTPEFREYKQPVRSFTEFDEMMKAEDADRRQQRIEALDKLAGDMRSILTVHSNLNLLEKIGLKDTMKMERNAVDPQRYMKGPEASRSLSDTDLLFRNLMGFTQLRKGDDPIKTELADRIFTDRAYEDMFVPDHTPEEPDEDDRDSQQ